MCTAESVDLFLYYSTTAHTCVSCQLHFCCFLSLPFCCHSLRFWHPFAPLISGAPQESLLRSASVCLCFCLCERIFVCCFVSVCVKFHRAVKLQIFQLNYLYSANKHSHVLAFLLWGSSLTLSKIHTPLTWARTLLLTHQQASEENEDQKWSSLCISKKNILHQSSKRKKAQKYKWSQIPSFFLFVDRFIDRTEGVNYGLLN